MLGWPSPCTLAFPRHASPLPASRTDTFPGREGSNSFSGKLAVDGFLASPRRTTISRQLASRNTTSPGCPGRLWDVTGGSILAGV